MRDPKMTWIMRGALLFALGSACSSTGADPLTTGDGNSTAPASDSGGTTTTGGAPAAGGSVAVGGLEATAGAQAAAGSAGTDATGGTGAIEAAGGVEATGGTETAGGTAGTSVSTGGRSGTISTGGLSTGGAGTGGGNTGGVSTGGAGTAGESTGGVSTAGAGSGGVSTGGAATGGSSGSTSYPPFILGADISRVQADEDRGTTFSDNGVTKDILEILKDHGFNYIRLRTLHDPRAPGGYSSQGYCDLEHTIAMGQRVRDAGMGFLLDFFYSDTWTDPDEQAKPAAWANLSFDALTQAVYDYTNDAITRLVAAGARPDMVQIGNEMTGGILFPDGRVSGGYSNLATLLKAGIAGVRDVDPGIKIVLHIDRCNDWNGTQWWVDGVRNEGVEFDILGQSCYTEYQGDPSTWTSVFANAAERYPDLLFIVAEYSQAAEQTNEVVHNIPDGKGLGTFIWEPTYWRETLFDWRGMTCVTNDRIRVFDELAERYGLR
jgi:arabinogalactan endo-1,4-beta-galactosidase